MTAARRRYFRTVEAARGRGDRLMFWRRKRESRNSGGNGYSDAFIEALHAQAEGTVADGATATAALEACAGVWARALAAAKVEGDRYGAVTPSVLACVGREWIRRGEAVFYIDTLTDGVSTRAGRIVEHRGSVSPALAIHHLARWPVQRDGPCYHVRRRGTCAMGNRPAPPVVRPVPDAMGQYDRPVARVA